MTRTVGAAIAVSLSLALAACGGGGDQGDNVTASDAQVVAHLKASNIDYAAPGRAAGTWRWLDTPGQQVYVQVPVPGNATEQDYATKVDNAIAQINTRLSGLLVLEKFPLARAMGPVIRVSYGTSYVPPGATNYQNYCANVATGPSVGNPIAPDSLNGMATNPVYLNLGNGRCDVTQDIVTHEFGHALGLSAHFDGFGSGPAISTAFWDVLATLYANPESTTADKLSVRRAAP